jgi:hypothetical protein
VTGRPLAKRLPSFSNRKFHRIAAWPDSFDEAPHPGAGADSVGTSAALSGVAPSWLAVDRTVGLPP